MIKTAVVSLFLCIAVSGAPRPETSTYVDGNVSSLKPNTGGTLVFKDNNSMTFRTGLAEVAVPYESILHAELGATQVRNHEPMGMNPVALISRLHKTETQLLTVEFKSGLGEKQTMTLQLAKPAASSVLATIQEHTTKAVTESKAADGKGGEAKPAWWGDDMWKTTRNQDSWNAKDAAGVTSASK
ncbi:MAG TPA: hypothetical protein VGG72_08295 [Bryobacteraceae bacterium]|jgi:hypothetical protein